MKFSRILIVAAIFASSPAFALDLHSARDSGVVVEKPTGYIEVAKPSAEADALVAEVNAKRKAEYERIAKEKKVAVDVVAKEAAKEISKNK